MLPDSPSGKRGTVVLIFFRGSETRPTPNVHFNDTMHPLRNANNIECYFVDNFDDTIHPDRKFNKIKRYLVVERR